MIGSPEVWTRDVVLIPPTLKEGDFTVTFPLDISGLILLSKTISMELGVETPAPEITLTAIVRTIANIEKGQIKEEYTQSTKLKSGSVALELLRPLDRKNQGESLGLKYEHRGSFSYSVNLKDNKLFGKTVLTPEAKPLGRPVWENTNSVPKLPPIQILHPEPEQIPAPVWEGTNTATQTLTADPDLKLTPIAMKVAASYPVESLDHFDLTFSYEMTGDKPITREFSEIGITAFLNAPGLTAQTFVLAPKKTIGGRTATITFPLDIGLFYAVIEAIEKERPATNTPSFYNLLVRAEVKGNAQSAFGNISDSFRSDLSIKLERKNVQWLEVRPATKTGFIKENTLVPNRRTRIIRFSFSGVLGLVALAISYGTWHYRRIQRTQTSHLDTEARRMKKKHKEILVEVESLPPLANQEQVVSLGSLEELVKAADALLKPVLHEACPGKHTYCVTDGNTRYVYTSSVSLTSPVRGEK
ncbi:MAG: hypothetical protein HY730_00575 [Candidatus Tectomicrobia bacterium]|uniref:Uncharacterized protein n=1 Tax=Tectimicrobiota bacterium TaxID=2528274 RepID=A0A933LPA1_UNCTE|nr:hypothetical protein [Candidatus Tectomicrobia bacterium]